MRISIDLRHDEVADLQKALTLITDALAERTGQKPAQASQPVAQNANTVPTLDSLRQNQNHSSQPTSTGLFAPRSQQPSGSSSFLPSNPRPVQAAESHAPAQSRPAQVSNQESFNMLNMLSGKKK